jgi:thiamine-monophosphate kinase
MAFLSEQAFLEFIDRYFPPGDEKVIVPRGDDCGVIQCSGRLCVSSDLFLEDVHFRRASFPPEDLGYKALAVNVSDIAAMGATPQGFNLNLMIPQDLGEEFWPRFFKGMAGLAREQGLVLLGGDLSRAGWLGVDITIWGAAPERLMLRGQCRAGDTLFALGPLGLARVGLNLLEEGGNPADFPLGVRAHLHPRLFVRESRLLAGQPWVRGLMDVSDGLAIDVGRFLGPGLGLELSLSVQDLEGEVKRFAARRGEDPLHFSLKGGEDYALLGGIRPGSEELLRRICPDALVLGTVTGEPGIRIQGEPFHSPGFDHFSFAGGKAEHKGEP